MQTTQLINIIQLIIRKEREEQRDKIIRQQWRDARRSFFQCSITKKLKEAGATEKEQQQVLQLFIDYKMDTQKLALRGDLLIYQKQIQQLQQEYNQIHQSFKQKEKECWSIRQIILLKYSSLKVVKVQYQQTFGVYGDLIKVYSSSAFEVFKMIHNNPLLSEVTIKGVEVQQLQLFIKVINLSNEDEQTINLRKKQNWIQNLNISNLLQLTIDAKLQFIIGELQTTQKLIDLTCFIKMLHSLSYVTVKIILHQWKKINEWKNMLQSVWSQLRSINSVKLDITTAEFSYISADLVPVVRSVLFGGLSSFTQITRLCFHDINFMQASLNDYLAIEQTLNTIFINNPITHLKIRCLAFPAVRQAQKLQSIDLKFQLIRQNIDQLIHNTQKLKSIIYVSKQELTIDELMFDSLQNIIILRSHLSRQQLSLKNFTAVSPSSIKILSIRKELGNNLCLIFPKLFNLISLSLSCINFGYDILSTIPSTLLSKLRISFNHRITDEDLERIDLKWTSLRFFELYHCRLVSEDVWNKCKFRGLMELNVDQEMLEKSKALQELTIRGIKINVD